MKWRYRADRRKRPVFAIAAPAILTQLATLQSTLINWGRHTIGTVPFALWFSGFWGAQGVLIGQAAGGIIFGVLGVWLALRVIDATPPRA